MRTPRQFVRRVQPVLVMGALCLWASSSRAQATPSNAVGRLQGKDISVENGLAVATRADQQQAGAGDPAGALVVNGSIVTVHSGHAHMTLLAGGEVGICGPAKFTLLQSGNSITL